jgi:hypothetical protein
MAGLLGEVTALTNGATLVLLPCSLDRQLAAHRLSKSLNAALLCQLEADSPDTALAALGPFL